MSSSPTPTEQSSQPAQQPGSHIPGSFRTDALTDIALTMPIFLMYHLGVIFLPVRNAADMVTARLVGFAAQSRLAYLGLTLALGVCIVGVLLMLGHREKLRARTFAMVALEGALYAMAMRALGGWVVGVLPMVKPAISLSAGGAPMGVFSSVVMSLGAGFYEELAFRVGVFGMGAKFLFYLDDWPKWAVYLGWAVVSSLLFSGWHHVGSLGESFSLSAFLFRTVCGMVFAAIYYFRGFAPAVWTHSLYDLWVMLF